MTVVDLISFEKMVNTECLETLGVPLQELPDLVILQDYFQENLSIKEAKLKAKEFVRDLEMYMAN